MSDRQAHASSIEAATDAQVRAVATEFLRQRPAIVIPFLVLVLTVLAASGAPRVQIAALGVAGTVFSTFFLVERARGRQRVVRGVTLFRSLALTALGIALATTATGALASPLLPMLFAPTGIGFAAFGRTRRSGALFALLGGIVLVLWLLSPLVASFTLADGPRRLLLAAAMIDAALLLRVGVASLAAAHGRAAETLAVAGEEIVRAAQARTQSLEALGSKVAHEVKNPLAAVRAVVEVTLEGASDERMRKRMTVAAEEIARIEKVLDAYGSHSHPLDVVRRGPVDVAALVENLALLLEARARLLGVSLALELRPSQQLVFNLDRDRMKEALINLLLNALDATPSGGNVTVKSWLDDDGIVLEVTDSGKGMDATTLAKLGTAFFSEREGGTGLGVSLARQIVAQHGGALSYASEPGRGTTASIRIPRPPTER